jgi:hypothetical protein
MIVMLIALAAALVSLGLARGQSLPSLMNGAQEAMRDIAPILLVIAGAGALKQVLVDSGVSAQLGTHLGQLSVPPLVLGWLVATLIRICLGSATVAGLTAAGIVAPVVQSSGTDPSLMVLAIGAGSLMCSHVNDSGFWMFKEYFGPVAERHVPLLDLDGDAGRRVRTDFRVASFSFRMKPGIKQMKLLLTTVLLAAAFGSPFAVQAASVSAYQTMPDDARAVKVNAKGDGRTDDTAAIQQAIDAAANKGEGGVVFLPSGRYRITRSILVPLAVRVYGVGPTRPVLVLGERTPGFQKGVANMVVFMGGDQYTVGKVPVPVASAVPFSENVRDANSSTFYSALSNVDFEIGQGNAGAVAVRFRVAQHGFLRHIDFHLGSGLAGIYQAATNARI